MSNLEDERILNLHFLEKGWPKVEHPRRHGCGTTLLEKVVAVQCQAKVKLNYHAAGLRIAMALPQGDTRRSRPPYPGKVLTASVVAYLLHR